MNSTEKLIEAYREYVRLINGYEDFNSQRSIELRSKIKELEEHIKKVNNLPPCPKCGMTTHPVLGSQCMDEDCKGIKPINK